MKKTTSINLSGIMFHIDVDAYETLNTYLTEIGEHFSNDDESEIIRDIEARIAELFTERLQGRNVVEMSDVTAIIETLGHPEQFESDDDEHKPQEPSKAEKRRVRKFYRDSDDKLIGGVASGLAAYIGWDTTLVRILFLIGMIFSVGWMLLLYFMLWIIVPEAKTAAQRLEMQGIEPNLENIKNYIPKKETVQRFGNRALEIISWLLKVALIIIIGGISIALFFGIFVLGMGLFTFQAINDPMLFGTSFTDIALIISCILFLLCPAIGLVLLTLHLINKNAPRLRWLNWTLVIVWIFSFFCMIFTSAKSVQNHDWSGMQANMIKEAFDHIDDDAATISETRACAPFTGIDAERGIWVELTQSDTMSVVVKAPDYALRNITTTVENGILKIENKNHSNRSKSTVYISTPTINSIEASEAVFVTCQTPFENLENLYLKTSEASQIEFSGSAISATLKASEASKIDIENLKLTTVTAQAEEASKIAIGEVENAFLTAEEASKITYIGTPKVLEKQAHEASRIQQK